LQADLVNISYYFNKLVINVIIKIDCLHLNLGKVSAAVKILKKLASLLHAGVLPNKLRLTCNAMSPSSKGNDKFVKYSNSFRFELLYHTNLFAKKH